MGKNGQKPVTGLPGFIIAILLIFTLSSCASMGSVTRKNESKFETTGLFVKPCKEKEDFEKSDKNKKSGFWAKFKPSKEERAKELNATINCNKIDLEEMIKAFNNIKESDEEKGILGDPVEEVKRKGFTIFLDNEEKMRRQSTEILYGTDALAAVGMSLNPPQLNTPEAIEIYKKYMKSHFAWTFKEINLDGIADRIYINTKNASTEGIDYKFVITFKDNHVFRRVIKGGPQNTVTQEKAFLLGPSGFLGGLLSSGVKQIR